MAIRGQDQGLKLQGQGKDQALERAGTWIWR